MHEPVIIRKPGHDGFNFWGDVDEARIPNTITVCFDFEWADQSGGHTITEIGMAVAADEDYLNAEGNQHHIIEENVGIVNKYCPTSKLGFLYGFSDTLPIAKSVSWMAYWLKGAGTRPQKITLVGHGMQQDMKIVDTQDMYRRVFGGSKPSLTTNSRFDTILMNFITLEMMHTSHFFATMN
jgi:hypothetical protein